MNDYADFKQLKEHITLERVLREMLGIAKLSGKKDELRCVCPICGVSGKGKRVFAANTVKNTFYCHACQKGGDIITLVALKEQCTAAEAGVRLRDFFQVSSSYASSKPGESSSPAVASAPSKSADGKDDGEGSTQAERDLEFILDL